MTRTSAMKSMAFALAAVASFAVLNVTWDAGITAVSASSDNGRKLRITKECSEYNGEAGAFCTITDSNLSALLPGSIVFYTQPPGIPAGLLDSNVVVDAGNGNRAIGRCTLDLATGLGVCTFSDGTGQLAGLKARVNVSAMDPEGVNWLWDGTYSFDPVPAANAS